MVLPRGQIAAHRAVGLTALFALCGSITPATEFHTHLIGVISEVLAFDSWWKQGDAPMTPPPSEPEAEINMPGSAKRPDRQSRERRGPHRSDSRETKEPQVSHVASEEPDPRGQRKGGAFVALLKRGGTHIIRQDGPDSCLRDAHLIRKRTSPESWKVQKRRQRGRQPESDATEKAGNHRRHSSSSGSLRRVHGNHESSDSEDASRMRSRSKELNACGKRTLSPPCAAGAAGEEEASPFTPPVPGANAADSSED